MTTDNTKLLIVFLDRLRGMYLRFVVFYGTMNLWVQFRRHDRAGRLSALVILYFYFLKVIFRPS